MPLLSLPRHRVPRVVVVLRLLLRPQLFRPRVWRGGLGGGDHGQEEDRGHQGCRQGEGQVAHLSLWGWMAGN